MCVGAVGEDKPIVVMSVGATPKLIPIEKRSDATDEPPTEDAAIGRRNGDGVSEESAWMMGVQHPHPTPIK